MRTINFKKLDIKKDAKVLDLGCGRGRHTHALVAEGAKTIALDIEPNNTIETRNTMITKDAPNTRFCTADAQNLPFKSDSFDRIICSEVLEHIIDYRAVIAEIWRITKPNGRIGISVPRSWPETICWFLSESYHNTPGGHVRIFNKKRLINDFLTQGFIYRGHHFAHGLHSPYWWLRCAVGVKRPESFLARQYHKILVYEIFHDPAALRLISKCADTIMGKSVVLYFDKGDDKTA